MPTHRQVRSPSKARHNKSSALWVKIPDHSLAHIGRTMFCAWTRLIDEKHRTLSSILRFRS